MPADESLTICHLPVEVLSHIFSFLPYSDVKEARLVCIQWYQASQDICLLDREAAVSFSEFNSVFQDTLLESTRDFLHLCIRVNLVRWCDTEVVEHDTIWYNGKFWAKVGPKLRSLSLHNCKITRGKFLQVLRCCSNLRFLEIVACTNLFKCDDIISSEQKCRDSLFELPSLQSLQIAALYNLKAELFDILVSSAPSLKVLSLNDCLDPLRSACPEGLTCEHMQAFLDKNSHRKFDLNLRCLGGDDFKALVELVSRPNVQLLGLQVHYNYSIAKFFSDHVLDLIISQKCLEELELTCEVGDLVLGAICNSLSNLKVLKLLFCSEVVRAAGFMFALKKLTSLKMMECYKVTGPAVVCGLCGDVNSTLKSLTLTYGKLLSPAVVVELARTHPSLTYLDLSNCDCVTSSSVQAIYRHLVLLQSLVLASCKYLDDSGLLGVHSALSTRLYPIEYSISRLKDLRMLNVSDCSIDGSSFRSGLKIPNLRHVVLDSNVISSEALKCFVENNRTIEYLQVAHCEKVTDDVLNAVAENLLRLKRINLYGCLAVTREGVQLLRLRIEGLNVVSPF